MDFLIKSKRLYFKIEKVLLKPYYVMADIYLRHNNYVFSPSCMRSRFYLPYVKNDMIQKYIFRWSRYYEQKNLDYICKVWDNGIVGDTIKNTIILDIGANIGNHTLYYINECNAMYVYCFEPVKDIFFILCKNMEINNVHNVNLIEAGVGEHSCMGEISHFDIRNTGGTTIDVSGEGSIKIVSIDELNITDRIGLVKIDVEGLELSVIKGMMKTLKRDKPFITIEIRHSYFKDISNLLVAMDYKCVILKNYKEYSDCLFYSIS